MSVTPSIPLPTKDIFLRSPFWVTVDESELDFVLCDLRIWTGDFVDEPALADIKLRSTALNNITSMDIAEFARDFVEVTFSGTAESNAVFISYELSLYKGGNTTPPPPEQRVYLTGLDGYGMFQDGANFSWYKQVMMTDAHITAYNDSTIKIPVKQSYLTGYKLQHYVGAAGDPLQLHTFRTVTGLAPVRNTSEVIQNIANNYSGIYADRIVFEFLQGADEIVDIDYAPCNKYGDTQIYFVNRLGCIQTMSFFGKFDVNMKSTSDKYKRNIIQSDGTYDIKRHQDYVLNKNGKISMEINSGWRREEENDSIIEMMLSEQVWIIIDSTKLGNGWMPKQSTNWIVPVNIMPQDTVIKNKINDKLINYTFKFDAAYDWVNTVR